MTVTSFPRAARTNRYTNAASGRLPAVYWDYQDIGGLLFFVVCVNALIRLAVRLHFLHSPDLVAPNLRLQALIIICLGGALYAILKFRYRRPVIAPLGWVLPSQIYIAISILGGVMAALAITYFTYTQGQVMPTIPAKDFFVLGFLLGPVLEESLFRGCLVFPVQIFLTRSRLSTINASLYIQYAELPLLSCNPDWTTL